MTVARVRTTAIAAVSVAAFAALTGCAQIPDSARVENCSPATAFPVQVSGEGSGPVITEDAVTTLTVEVTTAAGDTLLPATSFQQDAEGNPAPINVNLLSENGFEGVVAALQCVQGGETLEATMRADQLFADEYTQMFTPEQAAQQVTVNADVDRVYQSAATGRIAPQQNGIPAVVTAPDGSPGLTMPQEPAPTELRSATTISGFGPDVAEGDTVTVHLYAANWSDGRQLLTTWNNPGPALQLQVGADDQLYGVTQQLVGEQVGSQVVVVVPADTIATTQSLAAGSAVMTGDSVVFVIDVLGIE